MKTVRTTSGTRKIEDWNANLIPLQLRDILQDQRKTLIDRLLNENGLQVYVDHKMGLKMTSAQNGKVRGGLGRLMNAGIDIDNYLPVLEMVLQNENTYIDSAFFYKEIDSCIRRSMQESQLTLPHMEIASFDGMGMNLMDVLNRRN